MRQIRKIKQKIRTLTCKRSYLCNNFMAGHVSQNWNTVWPSLLGMYQKLYDLQVYEARSAESKAEKSVSNRSAF